MTTRKHKSLEMQGLADPAPLEIFFSRVNERRVSLGMSQVELAKKIGAVQSYVSRLEGGSFPDSPVRIVALAKALDVSLDWLFGLTD